MTEPMYCPMSFGVQIPNTMTLCYPDGTEIESTVGFECTPDCAWAANDGEEYWCIFADRSTPHNYINTRPLKDDAE